METTKFDDRNRWVKQRVGKKLLDVLSAVGRGDGKMLLLNWGLVWMRINEWFWI
jgi:hypothetical protein